MGRLNAGEFVRGYVKEECMQLGRIGPRTRCYTAIVHSGQLCAGRARIADDGCLVPLKYEADRVVEAGNSAGTIYACRKDPIGITRDRQWCFVFSILAVISFECA